MAGTDYINALGAGASFDTKKIVEALVNAERAPQKSRIEKSIANSEATISGLGKAVSVMNVLSAAAERLNDASDFKTYGVSNSQKGGIFGDNDQQRQNWFKLDYSQPNC